MFPTPRTPSDPPLPSLPPNRPRGREAARQFDALADLCRCRCCSRNFADEAAYRRHRPAGVCLTPERAGLTRQSQPIPCWAVPKETT